MSGAVVSLHPASTPRGEGDETADISDGEDNEEGEEGDAGYTASRPVREEDPPHIGDDPGDQIAELGRPTRFW